MKTFATMFSGGGLADVGLRQAGLAHAWGIELDAKRAEVAQRNGFDVRAASVLEVDPKSLARVDWLHASPPCDNFSQANSEAAKREKGRATELDLRLALSVADYARELAPEWVSVENVMGWQDTEPERAIRAAMIGLGYRCAAWVLDGTDFGTPQRRRRLFLIFSRTKVPRRPNETHGPMSDLFRRVWVGWECVCDGWERIEPRPLTPGSRIDQLRAYQQGVCLVDTRQTGACLVDVSNCNKKHYDAGVIVALHRFAGVPSATITQRSSLQILTGEGARTLTPRHIARLCGLPDSWITPDTLTMTREVCGLGVCPPVMRAIVEAQIT